MLEAALHFLEARQRSVAEVRRRLGSVGYREQLVGAAIERLTELGMLDDAAFATLWIESRDRARPRGERALRAELGQRGVDRTTVDAALVARREASITSADASATEGSDEDRASPDEAAAYRLLERKRGSLRRVVDPRARKNRAYALLARSGFDPSTASEVARRWMTLEAAEADPQDPAEAGGDEPET